MTFLNIFKTQNNENGAKNKFSHSESQEEMSSFIESACCSGKTSFRENNQLGKMLPIPLCSMPTYLIADIPQSHNIL